MCSVFQQKLNQLFTDCMCCENEHVFLKKLRQVSQDSASTLQYMLSLIRFYNLFMICMHFIQSSTRAFILRSFWFSIKNVKLGYFFDRKIVLSSIPPLTPSYATHVEKLSAASVRRKQIKQIQATN